VELLSFFCPGKVMTLANSNEDLTKNRSNFLFFFIWINGLKIVKQRNTTKPNPPPQHCEGYNMCVMTAETYSTLLKSFVYF
jgi:hypothetical protein